MNLLLIQAIMIYRICVLLICLIAYSCNSEKVSLNESIETKSTISTGVELMILGNVQDGGSPHIGCKKDCCKDLWQNPDKTRKVVSIGLIDHTNEKQYLIEASPDFTEQVAQLNSSAGKSPDLMPDGIFLTHAHIGHYTGLMYLGREAKGAKGVPVFAMPTMINFLSSNGPWDQLIKLENIKLNPLQANIPKKISNQLSITPILVPHRDEYSETVGFLIQGSTKSALFIPDIDKWNKWDQNIVDWVTKVDFAFVDATFYDSAEINNRDIAEIPHPFVIESMELFDRLSSVDKAKVHFIHLNHTNPLLDKSSIAYKTIVESGFNVAEFGSKFSL